MLPNDRPTLAQILWIFGASLVAFPVESNPNLIDSEWASCHWQCHLSVNGRVMTTYFSRGAIKPDAPTIEEMVSCLISDGTLAGTSFKEFCDESGYDTDSRKAYALWETIQDNDFAFRALFPDVIHERLQMVGMES